MPRFAPAELVLVDATVYTGVDDELDPVQENAFGAIRDIISSDPLVASRVAPWPSKPRQADRRRSA